MNGLRGDFPVLEKNRNIVYLDSACTSLKPRQVIDAEMSYYIELGACGGRSSHLLGRKTSEKAEEAREKVARFVGAAAEELIWTRNATEGLNLVANSPDYSSRRKVVTSAMEHHSVLLPFMRLRDEGRIELVLLGCESDGSVPAEKWEGAIDRSTALVVSHSWNNTTGTGRDVRELGKIAHDSGALLCIDGAQGVPHHREDMRKNNADFLCFSGHKMLGPTGIGALAVRKGLMEKLRPLLSGGGTVKTVSAEKVVPVDGQERFEAGVQHYSGMLGLAAACDYLSKIGMDKVEAHEKALARKMLDEIKSAGAQVYGPDSADGHGALYSFNFKGAKPHDVALMLDKAGIAVRSGFFCAQVAMESLGAKQGAVRASAYIYNTEEDVRALGEQLRKLGLLYS
ncbi:MAG TPA: cysteine desulfurase [Candidatus Bilamarchaeum sp.]|nr:cysteine desulfurase [Candidatus Bilamarchaeum sp.]